MLIEHEPGLSHGKTTKKAKKKKKKKFKRKKKNDQTDRAMAGDNHKRNINKCLLYCAGR